MINLANAFIIGSTILLSPSNPLLFKKPQNEIWISKPKIAEARAVNRSVVLKTKSYGSFHATGLGIKGGDPITRFLSISDQDYNALKKCPHLSPKLKTYPIQLTTLKWNELSKCQFQHLSLSDMQQQKWRNKFSNLEHYLSNRNIKIYQAKWNASGQREIKIANTNYNLKRFQQYASQLYPFYKLVKISPPKTGNTIIYHLTIFEFSKMKADQLGLSWPTTVRIRPLDQFLSWNPQFSEDSATTIGADFGEQQGVAKILAQPQIRTLPGSTALFQSGGEIPIRNKSFANDLTTWKSYGLLVDILTSAESKAGDEQVSLKFSMELSEPDFSTAINGVPGIKKRKLQSNFHLRIGETTVLTTMLDTRKGKVIQGLAGTTSIPIVKNLLGTESDNEQQTELWFAIKPTWEEIELPAEEFNANL